MLEPLKLTIQKSGRLFNQTADILKKCSFHLEYVDRSFRHVFKDFPLEILLVRDDDIPSLVHRGACDVGIVGLNEVKEFAASFTDFTESNQPEQNCQQTQGHRLHYECHLGFSRCRLSLAVPVEAEYHDLKWFSQKKIATSYPACLEEFMAKQGVEIQVVPISGSVETMPAMGVADGICDLVATGSSLVQHKLKEVATVFHSEAVMVSAREQLDPEKLKLLDLFCGRVKGVLKAQSSKYVMMNAPRVKLNRIMKLIPGLRKPTVMPLYSGELTFSDIHELKNTDDYVAVHAVATEPVFWSTIEALKNLGASSILVVPIEKIID
ncbi:MAG: ATP phosphoribosyltransferase [Proteobacteria bacterium]|nr:ATP phosphoribosyltransferase [Pseudomonadota bacterium]